MGREAHAGPQRRQRRDLRVDLPPRPADLPEAETIIGYHGSLYGDWFDWEALRGSPRGSRPPRWW
jgi:hypothetical protein